MQSVRLGGACGQVNGRAGKLLLQAIVITWLQLKIGRVEVPDHHSYTPDQRPMTRRGDHAHAVPLAPH